MYLKNELLGYCRSSLRKNYFLTIVYYVFSNYLSYWKYVFGNIRTKSGSTHLRRTTTESIEYIEEVFADYKHYSNVQRFYGRVAEVGPGDNDGVGMMFIADGCDSVDLVDRFYSDRDGKKQNTIYTELIKVHPELKDKCTFIDNTCSVEGVTRVYGEKAAVENYFLNNGGYQFIVSRAVLEHVRDPILALEYMVSALNKDGMLLHKVDLRDHGMFSSYYHELKFLEVPHWIYKRMVKATGRPNRILVNEYRSAAEKLPIQYKILVTRLAGVGEIKPHVPFDEIPVQLREKSLDYVKSIKGKICSNLKSMSEEDLCTAGIFIIAKRV